MLEIIRQPWHWSIAGILIGLTVPTLLLIGNKKFGVSSSLRHLCAMCVPANIPFFQYEWKKEIWNLFFVGGMLIGALIASKFLHNPSNIVVAESTKTVLYQYGITDFSKLMPTQCTSGHSIMGLSTLQWPSLVATICFMIGGFFSANIIIPFIFKLF